MAVITLSRQYGSRGDEVADWLCALLHYRHFDKWLMAEVLAESSPKAGDILDFTEDQYKMQGFLERIFGQKAQRTVKKTGPWTERPGGVWEREVAELNEQAAIKLVRATILAAYAMDNVVIVGRGGQVILRDKPNVLHVRIEAPLEARVRRLQQNSEFTVAAAQEEISARDKAAAGYIRHFYAADWADTSLYDLVVNTGRLDARLAAQMITMAVGGL